MVEQIPPRLLRRREVERRVGRSRSSIYALIADGRFPRPVRVGARAVRWVEAEVDSWIAARIAEREAAR